MKHLKLFEDFSINEDYKNHPLSSHVITKDDANALADFEIDQEGPGPERTDDKEIDEFIAKITGMTLQSFAEWRWPENPQKQFEIALDLIKK